MTDLSRRHLLGAAAGAACATLVRPGLVWAAPAYNGNLPYGGQYYGCSINGAGLGNTRYTDRVAFRFKAELTGNVVRVRWIQPHASGYATGNGGTIRISVCQDNGAGLPNLTRVVCQTMDLRNAVSNPAQGNRDFPSLPFLRPGRLTLGQVYHLVFQQLARAQGTISVDQLWSPAGSRPRSGWPFQGDTLAAFYTTNGGRSWTLRPQAIPIFELDYDNGVTKGQGYGMGGARDAKAIDGAQQARQRITPPRAMSVVNVTLRPWRGTTGSGNLTVTVETASGAVLATAVVPRAAISIYGETWGGTPDHPATWTAPVAFNRAAALAAGQTYYVRLSAPAGAGYRIAGTYKGFGQGFKEDKMRRADRAEYRSGGSWRGWSLWGQDNRRDVDLPLLLGLA